MRLFGTDKANRWQIHGSIRIGILVSLALAGRHGICQDEGEEFRLPTAIIDTVATTQLDRAREFFADQQWEEAVESIRRIAEGVEERLAPVNLTPQARNRRFERFVPVRQISQMMLSEFPEALSHYRRQVDPLAQQYFEEAERRDNFQTLNRIVSELFMSSYGDDALLRLGDLALERGDFTVARGYWQRISSRLTMPVTSASLDVVAGTPLWLALRGPQVEQQWLEVESLLEQAPPADPNRLNYLGTDLDLAAIRARLVLASIMEGAVRRAAIELNILQRLHAGARGTLAGREGRYAELLSELLRESRTWQPPRDSEDWPTFAGAVSRSRTVSEEADAFLPLWQVPLPRQSASNELVGFGRPRIAENASGLLSFHPLVAGQLVFWNDLSSVHAHHLTDSFPVWDTVDDDSNWTIWNISGADGDRLKFEPNRRHVGVPRFTMTVQQDKLFACMGDGITSSRDIDEDRINANRSRLIGLDLSRQGRQLPGFPIEPEGLRWEFDGAPLSDGAHLFTVVRHSAPSAAMPELHVVCYELATSQGDDVRRKWRVRICSGDTPADSATDEYSHCLLSLHQGVLYCNTNMGAVAAMNAEDGRLRWAIRYPRSPLRPADPDMTDWHYFRDLNPCLCHGDLVIVAPADHDGIFALDAMTGNLRWSNPLVDVVHLLGVGAGNLIASGVRLYWIDIQTGRINAQIPRPGGKLADGFARPELSGYGRGILAGDSIYWPTREQILIFAQRTAGRRREDGSVIHRPELLRTIPLNRPDLRIPSGNLVMAGGVLLIAGPASLTACGRQPQHGLRTAHR